MKTQGVKQKSERGSKEGNFWAGFLKFLGGSGFRGFVQQGVTNRIITSLLPRLVTSSFWSPSSSLSLKSSAAPNFRIDESSSLLNGLFLKHQKSDNVNIKLTYFHRRLSLQKEIYFLFLRLLPPYQKQKVCQYLRWRRSLRIGENTSSSSIHGLYNEMIKNHFLFCFFNDVFLNGWLRH